ncbi:MAG: undecaprenyl/decaprenyl-phosphate alpha-N-acetylglucosaminyl 1-phosphate transferase [Clostridiales bacterium]|jgi:UDP-GlcNAc:undecaprenyl-phosphate GlcNAc-1-phosphate transferase|nr:undecaprenyl/decaprenyl-phosphate alpha-N-acetylglucosaminyl 1-phosphate transferase [Clostridiales bacterium]
MVNNMCVFLALFVAFLITFSSTPLMIVLGYDLGIVDTPKDTRRVHKKSIPLIGGIGIFYGFIVSVSCFAIIDDHVLGILLGGILLVTLGVFDDIKPIKASNKLVIQIVAASIAVLCGVKIEYIANPFLKHSFINFNNWFSSFITIFWIVGITNAINLIDGLDGLAVGVSSIASFGMLSFALFLNELNVSIMVAAIAGSGLGFLPYNFNPAKIFMGDAGSTFLGFTLACLSIEGLFKTHAVISFLVPVLILGFPVFDTIFAIFRRALSGKHVMLPDKEHLHHKLIDFGFTQRQSVSILYTMTAALSLSAVVMYIKGFMRAVFLILSVLFLVIASAKYVIVEKRKQNGK